MPIPNLGRVPATERYAVMSALVISVVLTSVKFYAYYLTGSAAVFSDALESIVNVAASAFALYAIALSHEPADASHPYGHGKVEFLSATFEGGMIFVAGAVVVWRAVHELMVGPSVQEVGLASLLLAGTAAVNGVAGTVLVRIGRRRSSLAIEADGHHLISDVVTTAGVLAALGLVWLTGRAWIDPVCALLVGAYLFRTSYMLLRSSTAGLMDEQDAKDDVLIRQILDRHVQAPSATAICSYHKLRHRHHGRMHWVDFHLQVPPRTTTFDAHEIAGAIEGEIEKALGDADATAHMEPCTETGCTRCSNTR